MPPEEIVETTQETAATSPQENTQTSEANSVAVETPEYTPNFKFKVMEKEHEIPEYLRGAVKNVEHEKQLRELHEKAFGLDFVKPRFQETRKQYQDLQQEHQQTVEQIESLRTTYQRGDLDGFFQQLNIPQEKILNWLVGKLQYNELPQEQRQLLDSQKSAEQRAWEAESRLQAQTQQYQNQLAQAKSYGLETVMQTPEIKSFSEQYDQGRKPGAFRELVTSHGDYVWRKSNGQIDLTPQEAIKQVMSLYGVPGNGLQMNNASQNQSMQTSLKDKIPVIPNLGSGSGSPISAKKPRSIEDLKKLAASM